MGMENLANYFDLPFDSPEHSFLAEEAWIGGELVSVRFYLGRLIRRNLFRLSDTDVEEHLVQYISSVTSTAGGELMRGNQGWMIASQIVRYRFETQAKGSSALKAKNIAAIEAFLTNPKVTMAQLAVELKTTEKQLARISNLKLARKLAGLLGTN